MKKALYLTAAFAVMTGVAMAQPTIDGTLTDGDYVLLDDNTGGPSPGFGAGHEINALYAYAESDRLYVGIAGSVLNGNRIVVFIDSVAGGVNGGGFDRTGAPAGLGSFNGGTTFDAGFDADYAIVIGTNAGPTNYFVDLYTIDATTGSNSFIGDASSADVGANAASGSTTQGFEVVLDMSPDGTGADIAVDSGSVEFFAMYMSDGSFLSNQFISPAGSGDGNYGNGAVDFGAAAPNPVTYSSASLPVELDSFMVE